MWPVRPPAPIRGGSCEHAHARGAGAVVDRSVRSAAASADSADAMAYDRPDHRARELHALRDGDSTSPRGGPRRFQATVSSRDPLAGRHRTGGLPQASAKKLQSHCSARVSDPAETADRRSPPIGETFGRRGGSVRDRPQRENGHSAVRDRPQRVFSNPGTCQGDALC